MHPRSFYYFYTDRQGSVYALRKADGTWVNGNYARYDAYGGYRTKPPASVNPGISDRGYTGHRMNNTGTNNLGLIYMNARYYLPEVGRFISPDTIVPQPQNPQSFNRYAYALNSPTNFTDPSGHYAQCSATGSDGFYANCDEWMAEAIRILGLEGGLEGARLAEFFWQWFNDPGKMLNIKAYYVQPGWMYTRQFTADTASIFIDMNVVLDYRRGEIALLGHELEHVSQGTLQGVSIQGEVLAYQTEYRIRDTMGIDQTENTSGAMRLGKDPSTPYNPYFYDDLEAARKDDDFLHDDVNLNGRRIYDTWYEPNLPWNQEIGYRILRSLIVNVTAWLDNQD